MIEKIILKSPTLNFLKPENLPVNIGKVSALGGSSSHCSAIFSNQLCADSIIKNVRGLVEKFQQYLC